jgi:sugar lactone lactonase YvrE
MMKIAIILAITGLFMMCSQPPGKKQAKPKKGSYDVGFKIVQLEDSTRKYKLKSGETAARPIRLFVWYPAKNTPASQKLKYTDYLFLSEKLKTGLKRNLTTEEKSKIIKDFAGADSETETGKRINLLKNVSTHAVLNAEEINQKFPLLLFGPGGSTSGYFYSSMCEYLAGKGYIAMALPSLPYNEGERWPFNQTGLELHIRDMEFVLKYAGTQGNVDSKNIALIAFSVGGVSQALLQMKQRPGASGLTTPARAFVSLDGGTGYGYGYDMMKRSKYKNIEKMDIPYFHAHGLKKAQYIVRKDFTVFNKNKTAHKYLLTFDDLSHADFTSFFQVKNKIGDGGENKKTGEQYAVLNDAVLIFLDRYLKDDKTSGSQLRAMNQYKFLTIEHSQNPGATRKRLIEDFRKNNKEAAAALKEKNYERYKNLSHQLVQFTPDHPVYMYQYAKALALTKNVDDSLAWLEEIFKLKGSIIKSVDRDKAFEILFEHPKFKDLVQRANNELKPVNNSTVAFTIKERDLMSEGVAYDSQENTLYLGGIYKRKILAVTRDGKVRNFTEEKQDGLLSVIGMEVDEKRRHLWVCSGWSGRNDISGIKRGEPKRPAAIHKYHVDSGKLAGKYMLKDWRGHFFNDLTVSSKGDVFITDTHAGEVYTISTKKDELELLSRGYLYANGITISDDDRDLFIAHYTGIDKFDLRTKESVRISHGGDNTLVFADGLAYYKNSLIAQQDSVLGGVYRHFLNDSRDRVERKEALELYNPLFDFSTTGEISGDTYYYLANAQFRNYNSDGTIFPFEKLSDVYILETSLTGKAK